MTKKMLNIIFIFIGVLSLYLVYQFYYKSNETKIAEIAVEQKTLQTRIDELDTLIALEPVYDDGINNYGNDIKSKSAEFTTNVYDEDIIMYACNMEDEIDDLFVSAITFGTPELLTELSGADMELSIYSVTTTFTISTNYEGIQGAIQYLNADEDTKRNIDSLAMVYNNATGELTAVLEYSEFIVTNYGVPYEETSIPSIDRGTENIFGGIIETEE